MTARERFAETFKVEREPCWRLWRVHVDSPYLREGDPVGMTADGYVRLDQEDSDLWVGVCTGFIADVTIEQATEWFRRRHEQRTRAAEIDRQFGPDAEW